MTLERVIGGEVSSKNFTVLRNDFDNIAGFTDKVDNSGQVTMRFDTKFGMPLTLGILLMLLEQSNF